MRLKLFLFLVGVLALSQVILYAQVLKKNDQKWDAALKNIDARITNHKNDIIVAEQQVNVMEKNKSNVPQAILEGVKDPEKKFLEFMDYLDNSELGTHAGFL